MVISQKLLHSFLIFFLLLLCTASCNTTEPPTPPDEPTPELTLELEDVSCTETWINLTTKDLTLPAELTLKQYNPSGDSISKVLLLNTQDTLLYIDSLLPNQNYSFQVFSLVQTNQHPGSSIKLPVTTMDTTSHDFTFQSWTFGTIGSSSLYDVAIIDENNIIAVGEIMVADSSPNGYTTYGALHWDGQSWKLKRLQYGNNIAVTPRGIIVANPNEIYLASGSIFKWDGISDTANLVFSRIHLNNPNGTINKLWGSSSDAIYGVGNSGSLVFFNGTSWKKIESGTDIDINDVWGAIDPNTNSRKVFCAVSFVLQLGEHKILTLDENNKVDSIPWNTGRRVGSVWTSDGEKFYTGGGGVFQNKSGNWNEETSIPLYYTNRVRGNALNDVFVGGDFGLLAHFNGIDWRVYQEFLQLPAIAFNSITVKGNIIATVGFSGEKAMITIGNRN